MSEETDKQEETETEKEEETETEKEETETEKEKESSATLSEEAITTDDKFGYFVELVAYDTLTSQVKKLVEKVNEKLSDDKKILLVEDLNIAIDDVRLVQVKSQLMILEEALNEQIAANEKTHLPPQVKGFVEASAVAPTLKAIETVIGAVTDIADMFYGKYTIKGKEISLSDTALRILIAGELKEKRNNRSVYLTNFYCLEKSQLIETLRRLVQRRGELQNQVHRLHQEIVKPRKKKIAELEVEIKKKVAELEVEIKKKEDSSPAEISELASLVGRKQQELKVLTDEKQEVEENILESESLITAFDKGIKALLTTVDGQTASPFEVAVLREQISELKITHLLYAKIVSGGGDAITGKRWFSWRHVTYLGGSVVSYILADTKGEIVAANTSIQTGLLDYKLSSNELFLKRSE
ncbi:MAG: hypothetical protein PHF18_03880 [Methanosarcina sp.]|uniref:hypothetical protein n=1 Tax=Methanosarcina sp. TaxID=2213 RepID=UPI00261ACE19|nr:hypothetical protein [Methanosarcina sp.]MDD3245988.1 hypothetical protein [Methanosarcina sp.]MDD4250382.1 hypothetical protein [Methanosarcina sp.]